jgi:hypothetical protein
MIQGDFQRMIAAKAERLSGSQFCLVVKALHGSAGELSFGSEPVKQELMMAAQHLGHLLHRCEARTHRPLTPTVQKLASPVGRFVALEALEILLQQVGAHRLEVIAEQLGKLGLLLFGQVLRALEQEEAAVLEHRLLALGLQLLGLLCAHLVNGLAHVGHDVEAVKTV